MIWTNAVRDVVIILVLQVGMLASGFLIEQIRPVRPLGVEGLRLNAAYLISLRLIYTAVLPLSGAATTMIVNAFGGGLFTLPSSGVRLLLGVAVYALLMDGGEYLFHRAQHRIPLLWAMHSLHHSDPAVNVSTAPRHFWVEPFLKAITIYALVGLLVKANVVVVAFYGALSLYNYALHMNLRVGFGRWSAWLNSPQLHRLHHSSLPEHYNCNFNQFFPVFDLLFGTYRRPRVDEYPPTGLADSEAPRRLSEMLLWPWRRHFRLPQTPPHTSGIGA